MLALGDLLTQVQRKTPVVQIILNNESLDFVKIEMQEAGWSVRRRFQEPEFRQGCRGNGCEGHPYRRTGRRERRLAAALAHKGGPVVVDVVVDPYALSLPSHIPFHAAKASL